MSRDAASGSAAAATGPARVIIAGGWTGGHLFTALAIADALRRERPDGEVLLVGARGGMEIALARDAGLRMETIWLDGLGRGRSVQAIARNLALPFKLGVALLQARRIVARFRPDVVVGVGAYVSFPVVAMAARMGVPTVLHEANAVPGIANAWLARRADVVCVGLAEAKRYFVRGGGTRVVHTGNPVRPMFAGTTGAPSSADACARLGLDPSRRTLLVMGGSLGSARLNDWVLAEARGLVATSNRQILWQCGRAHHAPCRARLGDGGPGGDHVHLVPFIDDMAAAYAAADLVVSGAGAATVAELACLAKAAIVVPDRGVSEDHQARNGDALRAAGIAVWDDVELGAGLAARARALLDDPEALRTLGARFARLASPGAAQSVAAEIVALHAARVRRRG